MMERTLVKHCKTKVGTKNRISAVISFELHMCRGNRFEKFMISLPNKTKNAFLHSSLLRVIIESVWHILTLIRIW